MAYQKWSRGKINAYNEKLSKLNSTPGAIDRTIRHHRIAADGTDAYTLGAPLFLGQEIEFEQVSGANTPAATITVTGMLIASQNVWAGMDRTTAQLETAPRKLHLKAVATSSSALAWSLVSHTGMTVS